MGPISTAVPTAAPEPRETGTMWSAPPEASVGEGSQSGHRRSFPLSPDPPTFPGLRTLG